MLQTFRTFLNTRGARLFFVVLIVPFVLWGVADVARNMGQEGALAVVGGRKIEPAEFQDSYRQQLNQVMRMMGARAEATPEVRRAVAADTLDRLIVQAAIGDETRALGVVVPDAALRQAVFEIPAFRGRNGGFDRAQFENVLRQQNMTEGRFLELMRSDLAQRQLMEAVQVGVAPPETLLKEIYGFQRQKRVAEMVELPFSAAAEPPAPTAEDLKRFYADDPQRYSAPAFRRIKAVILSPDTLARDIQVPDADLAPWYEAHKGEFGGPETRSIQVLVSQDEAVARKLADAWIAGADWATIEKQAQAAGASSVSLDDVPRADIPGTELADATFKAAPETVTGPFRTAFGWQVVRVTKVTPGNERPLDAVRDQVRARIAREKATEEVYGRANKLEDALSAGSTLDDLPGDLGLAAVAGTMDAKGMTKDGEPAPIPGSPALRQAIVAAAFAAAKGDPPRMQEGPDNSYFAVAVEDETAPAVKPYDQVEGQVREDYERDARRKAQEAVAAKLLSAVKAGGSLDDAATVAGLRVEKTPPVARDAPTEGVAPTLVAPIFALKPGEATMVEQPEGFVVLRLASIDTPDMAADPVGAAQMRTALAQQMQQDTEVAFALALRERAKPTVNRTMLESLTQ